MKPYQIVDENDEFITYVLAAEITTTLEPIIIVTAYLPPRRPIH